MVTRRELPKRYAKDYGTERFDFSTTDWTVINGTSTPQDTTHFLAGTSALKCNKPDGTNLVEIKQTGLALDWTDSAGNLPRSITLWCYGEGELDEMNLKVAFKTAANADIVSYQFDGSYHLPSGWFAMRIPISEMSVIAGSNDNVWAAIATITIEMQSISSPNGDYTLWFDSMYTDVRSRPKITVVFDDAFLSDYADPAIDTGNGTTGAFDLMYNHYGMLGSSAAPTENIDSNDAVYLNTAKVQEMYDAGWEFCNQNTDDVNITGTGDDATYLAKLRTAAAYFVDNGWTGSEGILSFSGCELTASVNDLLEGSEFIAGRRCNAEKIVTGDVTATVGHPNSKEQSPINKFTMVGTIYKQTTSDTPAKMIDYIDMLIKTGSYGYIIFHKLTTDPSSENNINDADFATIIDYLAGKRNNGQIDVVTFKQYIDGLTNPRINP